MKLINLQFTQDASVSEAQWGASYPTAAVAIEEQPSQSSLFHLLAIPVIYKGYQNGFKQPVVKIQLALKDVPTSKLKIVQQAFVHYFNESFESDEPQALIRYLSKGIVLLQQKAFFPIFEEIQINKLNDSHNEYELWVPILREDCFHPIMALMLQFCDEHATAVSFEPSEQLAQDIEALVSTLKTHLAKNTFHFIQAAHQENIPWRHIAGNVYQYGHGCHARWLDNTFIDTTSVISTQISRNKLSTVSLLQRSGFPVPLHAVVYNEEEAIEVANEIGFPVVVKPHNQDNGTAVYPGLTKIEQVKKSFQEASRYSESVIIEEHIKGKDYRLLVLNGELIWAIERIPGGVVGDGVHSIEALINNLNLAENRGQDKHTPLRKLHITQDAIEYLLEQGYRLDSIPNKDIFVPINRIANVSTGGMPVGVFDKVHPDNRTLAESVAKLLRLNLAGIDFITPNIEESFRKVGGAIIEVNAQPELGTITAAHVFKQILKALIPNQGRIPILVVCDNTNDDNYLRALVQHLRNNYSYIGLVNNNTAYVNNVEISHAPDKFKACELLLIGNEIDMLIYCVKPEELAEDGLPFDEYHYLILNTKTAPEQATQLSLYCQEKIIIHDHVLAQVTPFLDKAKAQIISMTTFANASHKQTLAELIAQWLKSA